MGGWGWVGVSESSQRPPAGNGYVCFRGHARLPLFDPDISQTMSSDLCVPLPPPWFLVLTPPPTHTQTNTPKNVNIHRMPLRVELPNPMPAKRHLRVLSPKVLVSHLIWQGRIWLGANRGGGVVNGGWVDG